MWIECKDYIQCRLTQVSKNVLCYLIVLYIMVMKGVNYPITNLNLLKKWYKINSID